MMLPLSFNDINYIKNIHNGRVCMICRWWPKGNYKTLDFELVELFLFIYLL